MDPEGVLCTLGEPGNFGIDKAASLCERLPSLVGSGVIGRKVLGLEGGLP